MLKKFLGRRIRCRVDKVRSLVYLSLGIVPYLHIVLFTQETVCKELLSQHSHGVALPGLVNILSKAVSAVIVVAGVGEVSLDHSLYDGRPSPERARSAASEVAS